MVVTSLIAARMDINSTMYHVESGKVRKNTAAKGFPVCIRSRKYTEQSIVNEFESGIELGYYRI